MFIVEIFDGSNWNEVSWHTQQVDAARQLEIFTTSGRHPDQMRITERLS